MKIKPFLFILIFLPISLIAPAEVSSNSEPSHTNNGAELELPPVGETEEINRLLAVVEDRVITLQEYRNYFDKEKLSRENLNRIIDEKIIEKALDEFITPAEEEEISNMVQMHLQRMKEREDGDQFQEDLQEEGLTEEEFIEQMISQEKEMILLQRLFPEALRGIPDITTIVRGRLLTVENEKTAQKVHSKLSDTPTVENWNRLFQEYSVQNPFLDLKENGDLGWFHWRTHSETIEYPFFELSKYEVSEPFQAGNYYLIAFKTGSRSGVPGITPWPGMVASYEIYTRRLLENYRRKLPDILRENFTVRLPRSVVRKLNDAT